MTLSHAIALLLIPILAVACGIVAIWWRWVRDTFFAAMILLSVFAERLDVNFFSEAWYRGTTRGIQVSLLHILAFGLIIGCWLGRRDEVKGEIPRRFWPGSLGVIIAYFIYACISVITSQPKIFGAFELTKILGSILIFVSAAIYVRSKHEWSVLIMSLACAVGFEGAWAVKQKIFTHLDRVAGTLDHANSLSMYFCMATPPIVAAAYAGWTRFMRNFCGVCAIFAAMGLLLTVSRAGIPVFGLVAVATFLACASWKMNITTIVKRVGLAVCLFVVVAALSGEIARRYGEASLEEEYLDAHVDGRGIYLRLARNIATDHFFGVGLNNWSYHVSRTYGPQLGFHFEDYDYLISVYGLDDIGRVFGDAYLAAPAHNLCALTLGELGVPGLVLFLAMWARWFGMGAMFLFEKRDDPLRTVGVGLFFAVCGIFGQSLTEWVFRQTPIAITFHILVGSLASVAAERVARRRRAAKPATVHSLSTLSPFPTPERAPVPNPPAAPKPQLEPQPA